MKTNLKNLFDICIRFPESVCFLTDNELLALAQNRDFLDESVAENIQAERDFRKLLYSGKLSSQNTDNLGNSPYDKSIRTFLNADGIIPVVRGDEGFPLPFVLKKSSSSSSTVIDLHGREHHAWTKSIASIPSDLLKGWTVELQCAISGEKSPYMTGDSFHLPVFMAILRKLRHMEFNPLHVISTGCLPGGRLCKVDGINAKFAMASKMGAKLFIAPEQPGNPKSVFSISLHIGLDKVEKTLIEALDKNGLSKFDWRKCKDLMERLENEIHYGIIPLKTSALPRIERYEKVFREEKKNPEILDALSIKSLIHCETGNTKESIKLNDDCRRLAKECRLYDKYYELAIRNIVNLTDCGEFIEAERLAVQNLVEKQLIKDVPNENRLNELLMQLNGTLGQLYLYGTMSGAFPCSAAEKSKKHLQKAADIADKHADDTYESCQDLNYIHLWHAVNEFGQPCEEEAYRTALAAIEKLEGEAKKLKNRAYLYRQKWFGAYRKFLLTGEMPDVRDESVYGMPDARNAEGWTLSRAYP